MKLVRFMHNVRTSIGIVHEEEVLDCDPAANDVPDNFPRGSAERFVAQKPSSANLRKQRCALRDRWRDAAPADCALRQVPVRRPQLSRSHTGAGYRASVEADHLQQAVDVHYRNARRHREADRSPIVWTTRESSESSSGDAAATCGEGVLQRSSADSSSSTTCRCATGRSTARLGQWANRSTRTGQPAPGS